MSTDPSSPYTPDEPRIDRDDLQQPVDEPTTPPAPAPEQQEAEERRESVPDGGRG